MSSPPYDALLLVSFGGPEGRDQVLPFLENVLRGRHVPRERMLEVAEHYFQFGGVSPLNAQNRALIRALDHELRVHGIRLPIYWGNRNWHPLLPDAVRRMAGHGVRRALALVTSAFGGYSSCRQYRENLEQARREVGPTAPDLVKIRTFGNHPGFIEAMAHRVQDALRLVPPSRGPVQLVYTAHSIPVGMAESSPYERQLREACRLVSEQVGQSNWRLVYQSRSGPPPQPWLEPDVVDYLRQLGKQAAPPQVVLVPIGFVSDHMEVQYDLDTEACGVARAAGLRVVRAATVGTHPRFVAGLRQLIEERLLPDAPRHALGPLGPSPDSCAADCCLYARPT